MKASPMFNCLPGTMLSWRRMHEWSLGRSCGRALLNDTADLAASHRLFNPVQRWPRFLPHMQGNGRNLARQGQPRHLRLHPLYQKLFVKLAKRSLAATGAGGRALKQVLQIVVVVQIQSANEHRLAAALQLTVDEAIVSAAARLQPQPAVGPELPLAAEAVRRLHPPQQQRDPYRTQPRNRAQAGGPGNPTPKRKIYRLGAPFKGAKRP